MYNTLFSGHGAEEKETHLCWVVRCILLGHKAERSVPNILWRHWAEQNKTGIVLGQPVFNLVETNPYFKDCETNACVGGHSAEGNIHCFWVMGLREKKLIFVRLWGIFCWGHKTEGSVPNILRGLWAEWNETGAVVEVLVEMQLIFLRLRNKTFFWGSQRLGEPKFWGSGLRDTHFGGCGGKQNRFCCCCFVMGGEQQCAKPNSVVKLPSCERFKEKHSNIHTLIFIPKTWSLLFTKIDCMHQALFWRQRLHIHLWWK